MYLREEYRRLENAHPRTARVTSGYRSYSPELGRWPSRDPIFEDSSEGNRHLGRTSASSIVGGPVWTGSRRYSVGAAVDGGDGTSLYRFVDNMPVKNSDVLGMGFLCHCIAAPAFAGVAPPLPLCGPGTPPGVPIGTTVAAIGPGATAAVGCATKRGTTSCCVGSCTYGYRWTCSVLPPPFPGGFFGAGWLGPAAFIVNQFCIP